MNVNNKNLLSAEVKAIREDFSIMKAIRRRLEYEEPPIINVLRWRLDCEKLPIIHQLMRKLDYEEFPMKKNLIIMKLEYDKGQSHLKLLIKLMRVQIIQHREHPTKRIHRTLLHYIDLQFASEKDPNRIKGKHIFLMEKYKILHGWRKSWINF